MCQRQQFPDSHEPPSPAQPFGKGTLSCSPGLHSESSVCPLGKSSWQGHFWGTDELAFCTDVIPIVFSPGTAFPAWAWRAGRLLPSRIWVGLSAVHPHLDVRLLMPALGPRCLLSVLHDVPSSHSVPLFPPLVPHLSLFPKSSPCDTIFRKWTSHHGRDSFSCDQRALC